MFIASVQFPSRYDIGEPTLLICGVINTSSVPYISQKRQEPTRLSQSQIPSHLCADIRGVRESKKMPPASHRVPATPLKFPVRQNSPMGMSAALASVSFGFVLVRVRIRVMGMSYAPQGWV